MKTKTTISIALAMLCVCAVPASAQLNLNALKNRATNAVKKAARNAADKAVDKAVDAVVNTATGENKKDDSQTVQEQTVQTQSVQNLNAETSAQVTETPAAETQKDAASEALAKYLSYQDKIKAAIANKDTDFLLSDTFLKEIPALVDSIKKSPDFDIRYKADSWDYYKRDATSALYTLTTKAPQPNEYIPRLKFYVDNAEASTSDASIAFWLDRAMWSCQYLGDLEFIVTNTNELRPYWNKVRAMYDSLDSKYKRRDADYRSDSSEPEKIIYLKANLPEFNTQYTLTKAKYEKKRSQATAAHVTKTSSSSKTSTTAKPSNTQAQVKVKEVKKSSFGSDGYDVIGTNLAKIGSIKPATASKTDYSIYDKNSRLVGEIKKNNGSSGYSIYKSTSKKGEMSSVDFVKAAKMVLE